jgi:predicted nucleotidyltransferase
MTADLRRLLEVLHDSGFEFIVVGGTAALAHGAVTPTQDVDVAAPMTEENLARLLEALSPYHPKHATRPDLGTIPQGPAELAKFRLLLIDTDLGRLDVLGHVQPIGAYEDLETVELDLLEGRTFRVLSLDHLIAVKAYLSRAKDKTVEAELRAIRGDAEPE